jgi:hypothetical protein
MATDEDIDYSPDDITHIRKWMVNFLVEQPVVSKEMIFYGYDNNHKIGIKTLKEVPVKSNDILRIIPINDHLTETSTFKKIKILAKNRESGDVHMDHGHGDVSTNDEEKSPLQQSGNMHE